jgi:hypothetical protein
MILCVAEFGAVFAERLRSQNVCSGIFATSDIDLDNLNWPIAAQEPIGKDMYSGYSQLLVSQLETIQARFRTPKLCSDSELNTRKEEPALSTATGSGPMALDAPCFGRMLPKVAVL